MNIQVPSKCGKIGKRLSQGLFRCPSCNIVYNADLNATIKISERFAEQRLANGASLAMPIALHELGSELNE